jgi:hypothetical protein
MPALVSDYVLQREYGTPYLPSILNSITSDPALIGPSQAEAGLAKSLFQRLLWSPNG